MVIKWIVVSCTTVNPSCRSPSVKERQGKTWRNIWYYECSSHWPFPKIISPAVLGYLRLLPQPLFLKTIKKKPSLSLPSLEPCSCLLHTCIHFYLSHVIKLAEETNNILSTKVRVIHLPGYKIHWNISKYDRNNTRLRLISGNFIGIFPSLLDFWFMSLSLVCYPGISNLKQR